MIEGLVILLLLARMLRGGHAPTPWASSPAPAPRVLPTLPKVSPAPKQIAPTRAPAVLKTSVPTLPIAASKTPATPPWPVATPKDLPPFPKGWEFDEPPPAEVQRRAVELLPALWMKGAGAKQVDLTGTRWITYVATYMKGKHGVTAYRRKGDKPAIHALGDIEGRAEYDYDGALREATARVPVSGGDLDGEDEIAGPLDAIPEADPDEGYAGIDGAGDISEQGQAALDKFGVAIAKDLEAPSLSHAFALGLPPEMGSILTHLILRAQAGDETSQEHIRDLKAGSTGELLKRIAKDIRAHKDCAAFNEAIHHKADE